LAGQAKEATDFRQHSRVWLPQPNTPSENKQLKKRKEGKKAAWKKRNENGDVGRREGSANC